MKVCTKCNESKSELEFDFKNKARNIKKTYCKLCQKQYSKKHYSLNGDKVKQQAKLWTKNNRLVNQKLISQYLNGKSCLDCGNSDLRVLEFDHRDPSTKTSDVSNMLRDCAWDTILQEISKCDIRCANCHRIKTYAGRNYRENFLTCIAQEDGA